MWSGRSNIQPMTRLKPSHSVFGGLCPYRRQDAACRRGERGYNRSTLRWRAVVTVRCAVFSKDGGQSGKCDFATVPRVGEKVRLPWMRFVQTVAAVQHTGSVDPAKPPYTSLFVEGAQNDILAPPSVDPA